MTETIVGGKVQRIQAMLYAKASNEPELGSRAARTQSGTTSCLEPCAGKLARTVRQWGDGETHWSEGRKVRPVPTTTGRAAQIKEIAH